MKKSKKKFDQVKITNEPKVDLRKTFYAVIDYEMRFVKAHGFSRWDETKQKILDNRSLWIRSYFCCTISHIPEGVM